MKLAKNYDPKLYETDIYSLWEQSGAFSPNDKGRSFSLVVPPPNANGNLHMGHALSFSVQDIAARYHRLKGERVLFVPGADHAGFETQVVYERELEKQGKSRFDYSREVLYNKIFDFVDLNRDNFQTQIRKLGASVDWSRYAFSLDPKIVKQAYATFKQMWKEGLVYRGERLVNFCTLHGTAFADIEVDYREEKGQLWQIRYPLSDGSGELVVATTRPETMLGDTAVAVNPEDSRYKMMIGKTVKLPLTHREIPVIADNYVDVNFGTGAVKITPAHDPNDYQIAQRHDLPFVTVIGFDGKLVHSVPETFRGLNVLEGREAILKQLEREGLLVGDEEIIHNVGHCYKCATVIEPLLKEQWFIDIKPLADNALQAIRAGKIEFLPQAKQIQLERYLETIRDWNISRQIVWGIPIPAFQNEEDPDDWIYDERVDQEVITVDNKHYRRDADVFDTWFSSSTWPYTTLDYPQGTDFKEFYPLSLMETGSDLLYPWLSRMIMLGLYVTGEVPFSKVYLHGMITDSQGRKMSKSIGNVTDPMETIAKFGSDALRIGVISGQTPGNNQPYVEAKVIGGRNFINKLWNIARFTEGVVENFKQTDAQPISAADHWILVQYAKTKSLYIEHMDSYRFSEAYEIIYHFLWNDFADWYIEASKIEPNPALLAELLRSALPLVQPFAPFVSETIWQTLELSQNSLLINQKLIDLPSGNEENAMRFERIKSLVNEVRSLLTATKAVKVKLYYHNEPDVASFATVINQLGGTIGVEEGEAGRGIALTASGFNCWLDIDQESIDRYVTHLEELIAAEQQRTKQLQERLKNHSYLNQAPKELVEETSNQLVEAEQTLEKLLDEKIRFAPRR